MTAVDWSAWLPPILVATSLVPALITFRLGEERRAIRTTLNLTGALTKVALVVVMLVGVAQGHTYEWRMPFLPGADLVLRAEEVPLLFISLSALLWLTTTLYAIGYLEGSPHRSRFFGFFGLCVSSTVGIALAGNPITLLVFYELLTVATYPLVVHRGTEQAVRAGRVYLTYLVPGGAAVLIAVVWLHVLVGPVEFATGGAPLLAASDGQGALTAIYGLFIVGFGVKAALVPLHAWLPRAMVAPAPVSALLHAVAVVKAGAYGIVRVTFDLFGVSLAEELRVLAPLALVAAVTIVYGSLRALTQDELKRRLAFSTVSQVSYIMLGVAVFGFLSATGGLVHLVHQGIMKVTLFYCAGNVAETVGVHHVSAMRGIGRRMPLTMAAFTIAALGMIGLPPTAGFVSKWYLGTGALEAGEPWVMGVLIASTLLNAAYFLPVIYRAWFVPPEGEWETHVEGGRFETRWVLLLPPVLTALATLGVGVLAGSVVSPLEWASRIAEQIYFVPEAAP
jgi:multicomponent Na+:H+ antiporter subunit D